MSEFDAKKNRTFKEYRLPPPKPRCATNSSKIRKSTRYQFIFKPLDLKSSAQKELDESKFQIAKYFQEHGISTASMNKTIGLNPSTEPERSFDVIDTFNKKKNKVFKALCLKEQTIQETLLEIEGQNFWGAVTQWEKKYCFPLGETNWIPVVDSNGTIVAHSSTVSGRNLRLHRGANFRGKSGNNTVYDAVENLNVVYENYSYSQGSTLYPISTSEDIYKIIVDVNGNVLCIVDHDVIGLESAWDTFDKATFFIGAGSFLLKKVGSKGIETLVKKAANKSAANKKSPEKIARELVKNLKNNGDEVIINIGGEGLHGVESTILSKAINLNPVLPGRPSAIPRLVRGKGEDIARFFSKNSIDKVVANKLPSSVNPEELASGIFKVLKKNGKGEINIYTDAVNWSKKFTDSLVKQGVDKEKIDVISDVLIKFTKQ